jgi:hypothetical protein
MAADRYWRLYITAGNGSSFVGVRRAQTDRRGGDHGAHRFRLTSSAEGLHRPVLDGSAWQTQWTVIGSSGWAGGETRTFADPSPPVDAPTKGNFFFFG